MTSIISIPGRNASYQHQEYRFGYNEVIGLRAKQEDALAWHLLQPHELAPEDGTESLNPIEIGHRLWTTYRLLDNPELQAGTTAATTVYDGNGHFITAILADAASFVAVYDKQANVLGVIRLNSVTHTPGSESEKMRIQEAGGWVIKRKVTPRVNGVLAVSRAIGDNEKGFKEAGVCSEATIDITNRDQICRELKLDPENIGSFQLILTCDGFTDGSGNKQEKDAHERYLFNALTLIDSPGRLSEEELAYTLVQKALIDGSSDNISVAVQTITHTPVFIGVYDGHGGQEASSYVAQNVGKIFKAQCALNREAYLQQRLSVLSEQKAYQRDNKDEVIEFYSSEKLFTALYLQLDRLDASSLEGFVNHLQTLTVDYLSYAERYFKVAPEDAIIEITRELVLKLSTSESNKRKIINYYRYLNEKSSVHGLTNFEVIQNDKSIPTTHLLAFVGIVFVTVATLILPALFVMAIVNVTTGRHLLELLKGQGEHFGERVKGRFGFFNASVSCAEENFGVPSITV